MWFSLSHQNKARGPEDMDCNVQGGDFLSAGRGPEGLVGVGLF